MAWRYFRAAEFTCRCGCQQNNMDDAFVDLLDELRHRCGFPLTVNSGYRCPHHNMQVSSTGPMGPHTTGKAADLRVDRGAAYKLLGIALELGFTGIGLRQHGPSRFVHLDTLQQPQHSPRPTIWTYS